MATGEDISKQLTFDLPGGDRMHLRIEAELEQCSPESTLIFDILSERLKKELDPAEFNRIALMIKKLDWHMDLIVRDRKIKKEIQDMIDAGEKTYLAVEAVAGKYYLSDEHVYTIYYGKQNN